MNLVERYIEAVKFWLPAHLKDDVAAELADDIRSEIEEAEKQKGRKLTDDEIAAILKARGRPMIVASRYLPKRALIGPELYPIYMLVLKIVAAACLIPVGISLVMSAGAGRFPFPPEAFANFWGQLWSSLLFAFAIVTLIFAVIEHQGMNPAMLDNWNPKTLPPPHDPRRIKRGESIGEIAANMVLIAIFAAGYLSQSSYGFGGGRIVLCPEWVPYWQIVIVLALAEIALSARNLFHPFWSWLSVLARTAIDLGKIAAFYWLLQTHIVREFSAVQVPPEVTGMVLKISDTGAQYARPIALAVVLIILITAIWRMFHLKAPRAVVSA